MEDDPTLMIYTHTSIRFMVEMSQWGRSDPLCRWQRSQKANYIRYFLGISLIHPVVAEAVDGLQCNNIWG